jgi:hypothetical protein
MSVWQHQGSSSYLPSKNSQLTCLILRPVPLSSSKTYSSIHLPLHNLPPPIGLSVRNLSHVPGFHYRDGES